MLFSKFDTLPSIALESDELAETVMLDAFSLTCYTTVRRHSWQE